MEVRIKTRIKITIAKIIKIKIIIGAGVIEIGGVIVFKKN